MFCAHKNNCLDVKFHLQVCISDLQNERKTDNSPAVRYIKLVYKLHLYLIVPICTLQIWCKMKYWTGLNVLACDVNIPHSSAP